MLKSIIFDLDGTLTDSDKVHFQVFRTFFAQHNVSIDQTLYRRKISGRQNAAIWADFLPELSAEAGRAFSAKKEATFRTLAKGQLMPLPGLMNLLDNIQQQGLAAALVTNAPPKNAEFMLAELGLSDRFHPVVIGDYLPRGKPDPLPYQTALDQLAISPTEAIAFEDSTAGIRSATGAGIKTIGVTTTHTPAELMAAGATDTIANFTAPYVQTLFVVQP